MIAARLVWGLFASGFVAYAFHRSWRWEHGKSDFFATDLENGKETNVWVTPLYLPILMVLSVVLFVLFDGMRPGIESALRLYMDIAVNLSAYYILLLIVLPLLRRFFSARACSVMWMLPVFLFWCNSVIADNTPPPPITLYIPRTVLNVLIVIWLAGFAAVFGWKIFVHIRFRRRLLSAAAAVVDPEVLSIWEQELDAADYKKPVKLVRSSAASAPLSMGNTKRGRVTILPEKYFPQDRLRFILRHEIRHLQRCDVDSKIFWAFFSALCWYNPLVWIAMRKASDDLELSCDEMVLTGCNEQERRGYANLLLDTAADSRGFSTCLSAAAASLRYRMKNAVTLRRRMTGTFLIAAAMLCCVMGYGFIAVTSDRGTVNDTVFDGDISGFTLHSLSYEDEQQGYVYHVDEEKLLDYLGTLQMEKFSSMNDIVDPSKPQLDLYMATPRGSAFITITDNILRLNNYHYDIEEYYILNSSVDWDYVRSCLGATASAPY